MVETITISLELANQISVYLGRRAYDEVSPFIERFRTEAQKSIEAQEAEAKDASTQ